ncbi:TPA: hypothetical protein PXR53_003372 [Yersinia enterocolitica]|nr:hypothetical protein [Yersinia enterocolitica]
MTDEIKTGGLAFPVPATDSNYFYEGMTLHDYFAAKAMAAILSNPAVTADESQLAIEWVVRMARDTADAMIKARR